MSNAVVSPQKNITVRPAPILFFVGVVSCCFGIAMLVPMLVDLADDHEDYAVFVTCAAGTLFLGAGLAFATYDRDQKITLNETLLLLPATWLTICMVSAVPFMLSELRMPLADAVFEAVSGLTNTGSTVIVGLDNLPRGLLMWRSLLMWIGGFGVVTIAVLALPFLRIGGLQLFSLDLSPNSSKFLPRIAEVVQQIGIIYTILTFVCTLCFWIAGMSFFDAANHAMTTIATGGYSTHDAGFGFFASSSIEWLAVLFMILGAMPFGLYIIASYGRPGILWRDEQVRLFLGIIAGATAMIALWRLVHEDIAIMEAIRSAAFAVVATITTSGFTGHDYSLWGGFPETVAFLLMLIGGCTGSTVGGIKVFRVLIMLKTLRMQVRRQIYPHGAFRVTFNGDTVSDAIRSGVATYIFTYLLLLVMLMLAISAFGLTFTESLGAAATALGNVGPGLGPNSGPCCTFKEVPAGVKWLMSFGMLAGRLEILILLIPFSRSFWRN
jgi:trk system potassium uptake protein TrkH